MDIGEQLMALSYERLMFLGQELLKAVQVFWQENVKGDSRCIAGAFNAYHGRISCGFDEKE